MLARPDLPEDTQRVTPAGMGRLLGLLGRLFDYVVVDSVMSIDPVYQTLVESSDVNLVVMQLNVPSAKNAERFVTALRRMGIDPAKIQIVVNRFVKKGWDIDPAEVEKALVDMEARGLPVTWLLRALRGAPTAGSASPGRPPATPLEQAVLAGMAFDGFASGRPSAEVGDLAALGAGALAAGAALRAVAKRRRTERGDAGGAAPS